MSYYKYEPLFAQLPAHDTKLLEMDFAVAPVQPTAVASKPTPRKLRSTRARRNSAEQAAKQPAMPLFAVQPTQHVDISTQDISRSLLREADHLAQQGADTRKLAAAATFFHWAAQVADNSPLKRTLRDEKRLFRAQVVKFLADRK